MRELLDLATEINHRWTTLAEACKKVRSAEGDERKICPQHLRAVFAHFNIPITPKRGRPKEHISPAVRQLAADELAKHPSFNYRRMTTHLRRPEFAHLVAGLPHAVNDLRRIYEEQGW